MARFTGANVDNYGAQSSNNSSFFSLKNDMDTARVRFMYSKPEDVEGLSVHKVKVGDKERYVNCLREYNSPIDECPFCKAGIPLQAKFFVPVYNEEAQQVQIWERGKKFYGRLAGFFTRYPNLVSETFDIERHGERGDQRTEYEIYPMENDGTTLEDLPEVPQVLGTIVLDKSYEDMADYIETGSFPPDENTPARRQPSRGVERNDGVARRTPQNRGHGDRF